jgi:hypothetical protein
MNVLAFSYSMTISFILSIPHIQQQKKDISFPPFIMFIFVQSASLLIIKYFPQVPPHYRALGGKTI